MFSAWMAPTKWLPNHRQVFWISGLARFERRTHAKREGTVRKINICNCPVSSWSVIGSNDNKLDGHGFYRNEEFSVSMTETKPGDPLWEEDTILPGLWGEDRVLPANPEKIGTLKANSRDVHFYLQPDAFALFWTAAEATDGATRHVEIEVKPDTANILTVLSVYLIEDIPAPRLHPVVAELRVIREKAKSIVVGFAVVLIV